jgi:hypothetical protein
MLQKFLLSFSLLLFSFCFLQAQDDDKPAPFRRPEQSYSRDTVNPNAPVKGFEPKKKLDLSKFIIEPNIQLSFGSGYVNLGLSPYVGYQIWKGLYGGGGVTYLYTRTNYTDQSYKEIGNYHTYGGGVFLQYNIWKGLFARVKGELLHRQLEVTTTYGTTQIGKFKFDGNYPGLFVGAGYNMLRSKNFFFPIMISYNLLNSIGVKQYAPYRSGLVVQLGFVNIF